MRVAQSFNEEEIKVLDAIFLTLLRGGDARSFVRAPAAQSLVRKVQAMKASLDRQKAAAASAPEPVKEKQDG